MARVNSSFNFSIYANRGNGKKNVKWFRTSEIVIFYLRVRPQWQSFRALNWCIPRTTAHIHMQILTHRRLRRKKRRKFIYEKLRLMWVRAWVRSKWMFQLWIVNSPEANPCSKKKAPAHMKHYAHFAYSFPVIYYLSIFLSCAFDKRWTRQEIIARTDNNGQTSSEWEKCMKTTCIRLDEFRRIKFRKIHSPPENSNLIFWMFDEVEYSNRNRSPEARNVVCVCGQNALPFLHSAHTFAVDVNLGDDKNTVTSSQAFGRAVRIGQVMITYH